MLTDREFAILLQYINLRVRQLGFSGPEGFTKVLQIEWDILNNQEAMLLAVEDNELTNLLSIRNTLDANRGKLDDDIARLEGATGATGE